MNSEDFDAMLEDQGSLFEGGSSSIVKGDTDTSSPVTQNTVNFIPGTLGDDTLVGGSGEDFLNGRAGNDDLLGAAGDDLLIGGGGDDTIRGASGDDEIIGSGGSDDLNGNLGDDTLSGDGGADTLRGGDGADLLSGGSGADYLRGGDGDDDLLGGGGSDTLSGGDGNDVLKGELGSDSLIGGSGDDFLDGGAGINVLAGGEGADVYVLNTDGFNNIDGFSADDGDVFALDGLTADDISFVESGNDVIVLAGETGIAALGNTSLEDLGDTADLFTSLAAEKLSVSFESISVPETIDFGDTGTVYLTVTNDSAHDFTGSTSLDLYISTDDDRDSESDERNDGLLSKVDLDLDLAAGESTTVHIEYENLTSVIAPGAYHLLAGVEGGELTSELVSANGTDGVLAWHATALNAIQEFGETDNDTSGIGIEPTVGSRALAIVQTSVFNAANAFDGAYDSYLGLDPGAPAEGASQDAAVAGAAVTALANVLPGTEDLSGSIVAQLEASLGLSSEQVVELLTATGLGSILEDPTDNPDTPEAFVDPFLSGAPVACCDVEGIPDDIVDGFLLGINAASQIIDARSGDGFTGFFQGLDDPSTYEAPDDTLAFLDYVWRGVPALDDEGNSVFTDDEGNPVPFALSPGWGQLLSFSGEDVGDFFEASLDINGDGAFLDGNPFGDPFEQARYIAEINEVRTLGAVESTDVTTVTRNQDQTEIAIFWAYDRADTFRPYGQLQQIAQEAAFRSEGGLVDNARTIALTSIALADASIAAWLEKYDEVQPRPSDVISGDGFIPLADNDGFDETFADPDWVPLLPDPAFPDFLSGHSVFAGAFSGVLDTLFPDATNIEVVSQELVRGNGIFTTSNDELFDIDDFNSVRTFDSYAAIGTEDAVSRIFGGVHVSEATLDAVTIGNDIGGFVATNLLSENLA